MAIDYAFPKALIKGFAESSTPLSIPFQSSPTEDDAMKAIDALQQNLPPLLKRQQVEELLDCSTASIYRWMEENPLFPQRVYLNPAKKRSAVRWWRDEVIAYLMSSMGNGGENSNPTENS